MGRLRCWLLPVTLLAALGGSATAGADAPAFRPCPVGHLVVKVTTGGGLPISLLGVSHLSCARALEAVHAGSFALTPAYPIFSTPDFRCTSPIGPPRPGPTRYVVCRRGQAAFRFHGLD